ncbi:DNA methyltransferase [Streptococcus phage 5093]|uniref:Cytosine-specific methyltransferase n=1 Tax=Streptococcus phage 5093 TaxID=646413 RepID=C5IUI7_9CAUD|nr:DNA methyltransferase [Streptococcus phage 5093]ACR45907.1 putative DNA methylase [Streptococcus phage 5093]
MKFIDLFAGIGGFRLGMESAGHECVGFCEIDKFARASYKAIHNTEGEIELHDITQVTDDEIREIGHVDAICGGFPCQAFSIAGHRRGFEDTRGTLFFEIARFAAILKPKYLFLENVKGLLNHDKGNTFEVILSALDELGYDVEWQVLNSKDFGVPQNRERLFIIGHLRGERGRKVFPITGNDTKVNNKRTKIVVVNKENGMPRETNRVYSSQGLSPTLNTMQGGGREPKIAIPVLTPDRAEKRQIGKQAAQTLDTSCNQATITKDMRIRKLTPRECWRLQGFPDWAFDKAQEVNSNSQLYKQAGNSVTVNVIKEIARNL